MITSGKRLLLSSLRFPLLSRRAALLTATTTTTSSMTDATPTTNAHFLDRPAERATRAMLDAIGVMVEDRTKVMTPGRKSTLDLASPDTQDLQQEHRCFGDNNFAVYSLKEGSPGFFIDVRDSADAWIRLQLTPGIEITLNSDVWRRFVLDPLAGKQLPMVFERLNAAKREFVPRFARKEDANALRAAPSNSSAQFRELVCQLCRQYYDTEWMTGTGGAMSLRFGERIFVTPSGVPKERLTPDDLYVLDREGAVISVPAAKPGSDK